MPWKKGQSGNPAGRRKTAEKRATEEIVRKALEEGTTPLQVLLEAMKEAYEAGGPMVAAAFAKEAAPYVHPKLSNVDSKVNAVLEHYTAQPVPVEQRNTDSVAGTTGTAATSH